MIVSGSRTVRAPIIERPRSNFDADEPTARASSAFYCGSYAFAETFANSNESRDAEAMRIDTVTHSAPVVTVGPPRSPDLARQPTVRAPVAAAARSMPTIPLHAPRPCRRSPTPSFLSAATADQTTVTNYPAARAHPSSSASSSSSAVGWREPSAPANVPAPHGDPV